MKLIVGLGNPGEKYKLSRHNVGFDVIDLFRHEVVLRSSERYQDFSLITEALLDREELILAKPQTFMNSSGKAVSALAQHYNIPIEDIFVIYDDLNLELGLLRIRRNGSAGGHKGVQSIIDYLGSQNFPRLRIGIGQPPQDMEVIDYVLGDFTPEERDVIEKTKLMATEALKMIILQGLEPVMNKFNSRQKIN